MGRRKKVDQEAVQSTNRNAISTEARNNQCISLAMDLALEQLQNGTATSQVICHFLKLATEQAKLELEKTKRETKLLEVKAEAIDSGKRLEELYSDAIAAMKSYQGISLEETVPYE